MSIYERYRTADEATAAATSDHLICDDGPKVWPRFCLVMKPKVGDPVSKSFNGDSYPAGEIKSISDSYRRIETTTGVVFWRVKQSSAWRSNHTWFMISGHVYEQNPSF